MRSSGVVLFLGVVMGVVVMGSACSSGKGKECTALASCCGSDAACKKVADNAVENDCKTVNALYCTSKSDASIPASCTSTCAKICPTQKATCEAGCAMVPASCLGLLDASAACLDKASDAKCNAMGYPESVSCAAKIDAVTACANPPATCASVCAKVCPTMKATCEAGCAMVPPSCKTLLDNSAACLDSAADAKCNPMGYPESVTCKAQIDAVNACVSPSDGGGD